MAKDSKQPDWLLFEIAVSNFLDALGRGAKVTHDVKIPDIHTGLLRQRDVMIECAIFGHYPVKLLVSCKNWATPLDQQDIDHFNGEFISSGAQIGILYAKSGYNSHALEKAKRLGFHCCRLYENEPTDMPEVLFFPHFYHFDPRFRIIVRGDIKPYNLATFGDVLKLPTSNETVLDLFSRAFDAYQDKTDSSSRWSRAATGSNVIAYIELPGKPQLEIELQIRDRKYQAKVQYTMLNGSYNITENNFIGNQAMPVIDTQGVHPGPGWEEVETIPPEQLDPSIAVYMWCDGREWLSGLASHPLQLYYWTRP